MKPTGFSSKLLLLLKLLAITQLCLLECASVTDLKDLKDMKELKKNEAGKFRVEVKDEVKLSSKPDVAKGEQKPELNRDAKVDAPKSAPSKPASSKTETKVELTVDEGSNSLKRQSMFGQNFGFPQFPQPNLNVYQPNNAMFTNGGGEVGKKNQCPYNPCLNSGICYMDQFTHNMKCICMSGYSGVYCENNLNLNMKINYNFNGAAQTYQAGVAAPVYQPPPPPPPPQPECVDTQSNCIFWAKSCNLLMNLNPNPCRRTCNLC